MISSPALKSLAHNKYQVAGRQLSLFITLDQTKLLFCCQLFLFKFGFWMKWTFDWSRSEFSTRLLVSCRDDQLQSTCSCWFKETLFLANYSKS